MLSRREFVATSIFSLADKLTGKLNSFTTEVWFSGDDYSERSLREYILWWKPELLKGCDVSNSYLEIVLVKYNCDFVRVDLPVIELKRSKNWDLFPDPGHVDYNKPRHPLYLLSKRFDSKLNELFRKNPQFRLRDFKIFLRVRESKK